MATLKKLSVQGVRSVGPSEENKVEIKFRKPFTMITGQNGAGKTTIIESLKYATSGQLPSNAQKGGWIHHPKQTASNQKRNKKQSLFLLLLLVIYY